MKGWRTFAVQALTATLGVAVTLDWAPVLGDRYAGLLLIMLSMVNTGLRMVTTTPPGQGS